MRLLMIMAVMGVAVSVWADSPAAPAVRRVPVVVELFTSEGCSSCPPADRLLADLIAHPPEGVTLVPLAQHVDYWDHLGWTDPFASHAATQRQYAFADAFHATQVYTPQLVVDGQAEMVGSDRAKVVTAIAAAAARPKGELGVLAEQKDRVVQVHVRVPAGVSGELIVALTEDGLSATPSRGENADAQLQHQAVVRQQVNAKALGGSGTEAASDVVVELTLPAGVKVKKSHVAAFVQQANLSVTAAGIADVR